jgi:hypothetical protein
MRSLASETRSRGEIPASVNRPAEAIAGGRDAGAQSLAANREIAAHPLNAPF